MNKTILTEVNGWTPVIDSVCQELGLITAAVFGRIWRYCQGEKGICYASLERISADLGIDRSTVQRHAKLLVASGYLVDLTPDAVKTPHIYADTGKAGIKAQITVAHSNTSVAQDNSTVADSNSQIESVAESRTSVAESRLKIDKRQSINKQNKRQAVAVAATALPTETNNLKIEMRQILYDAGIWSPTAHEIADLPHVTPEYLKAHIAKALAESVNVKILITRLRNGDPPPLTPEQVDEQARQRYISGPLGQFVEH